MKRIIHVNRHNIAYNKKDESVGNKKPVLTCKTYKENTYADELEIVYNDVVVGRFVYRPEKPLSCGATVWFETTNCNIYSK